jgi:hypothetical protein
MAALAAWLIASPVAGVGSNSARVSGNSRLPMTTTNPAIIAASDSVVPTPRRRSSAASPRAATMQIQVGSSHPPVE